MPGIVKKPDKHGVLLRHLGSDPVKRGCGEVVKKDLPGVWFGGIAATTAGSGIGSDGLQSLQSGLATIQMLPVVSSVTYSELTGRSADLQSISIQNCNRQGPGHGAARLPDRRRAECNSAIRQIENLRYVS